MDLAKSSIWSNEDGFGGDGDPNGTEIVGQGRCVVDGPFAHLRPILYNHTYTQHCLSRGFHDGETMGRLPGSAYKPEKIGEILREPTYEGFRLQLEVYLHGSLHQSVNGDFKAMTAANGNGNIPLTYSVNSFPNTLLRSSILCASRTTRSSVVAMAAGTPSFPIA